MGDLYSTLRSWDHGLGVGLGLGLAAGAMGSINIPRPAFVLVGGIIAFIAMLAESIARRENEPQESRRAS